MEEAAIESGVLEVSVRAAEPTAEYNLISLIEPSKVRVVTLALMTVLGVPPVAEMVKASINATLPFTVTGKSESTLLSL